MSNFSGSRLYQHKAASNVKHVSIHASLLYTSSVNELVKPLNISKPVCCSNATKCYVCNTGSVGQFIKPFDVSKPVCADNATERNVCNTSNVSQLVKLLNVSKTVCSSNVAKCNICKVGSVSQLAKSSIVSNPVCSNSVAKRSVSIRFQKRIVFQLVKTFNVTESVCSSNASNSVICNSTCNLVSNFASDFQSVKLVRKFFDVNPKCLHWNLYVTYLFDRHNIFLFCIYKVTGECINIFHQRKIKSNISKIYITLDINASFLVIFFVIFSIFKQS